METLWNFASIPRVLAESFQILVLWESWSDNELFYERWQLKSTFFKDEQYYSIIVADGNDSLKRDSLQCATKKRVIVGMTP